MKEFRIRLPGRKTLAGLVTAGAVTVFVLTGASSCSTSSQQTESTQAQAGINLLLSNQPVPVFATSELRRNLAEVEAIQALGTPTTSFFFAPGAATSGPGAHPVKVCASQGEPIHATDSLSNPHQVVYNASGAVIDQMDPNGIYPGNSEGTYVLCLTAGGQPKMSYYEGVVEAESGTAVWDDKIGMINDEGPSQLPVCVKKYAQSGDGTNMKAGTPYFHCTAAPAGK